MINKFFIQKTKYPKILSNKKEVYFTLKKKGKYKQPNKNPILEELTSYETLRYLQKTITDFMFVKHKVIIPYQNILSIKEIVRQEYINYINVFTPFNFSKKVTDLQIKLKGNQAYHNKYIKNKPNFKFEDYKTIIINNVIKRMEEAILVGVKRKEKYIKEIKRPYIDRIRKLFNYRVNKNGLKDKQRKDLYNISKPKKYPGWN